ncbi:MAG: hypothetical protein OXJ52_05745 [Oligoflexia bacterium]|nr:hypothetical protein [Oligoflexia bacterium]
MDLEVVPIIAKLPIPSRYLTNEELRSDLRLIVRETFYNRESVRNRSPLIQKASFTKEKQSEFSQAGRIIYESPIDWSAKLEDLIVRRAQ